MSCIVQTPESTAQLGTRITIQKIIKGSRKKKPKSPTPLLPAVATPMSAAMMHIAIMLRKQNKSTTSIQSVWHDP